MSTKPIDHKGSSIQSKAASSLPLEKLNTWQALIQHTCQLCAPQIDAFTARLSHALFGMSEQSSDSKVANLCFHGAQLLKTSAHNYYSLCTRLLDSTLQAEHNQMGENARVPTPLKEVAMTLVSYEEMDLKLSYSRASRSLELSHAESIAALNMRLASLMGVENINVTENPFRPEVFLRAFHAAWCELNPEKAAHELLLPTISELIFDLAPIYHGLNELLIARGILPDLQETYRQRRKQASVEAERVGEAVKNEVTKKLEQYFSGHTDGGPVPSVGGSGYEEHGKNANDSGRAGYAVSHNPSLLNPAGSELFQYLADVQKNMAIHQLVSGAQNVARLSQLRQEIPHVLHTGVERHTFDLLSQVFDGVFGNHEIPDPIKNLIGLLQVPVLKAALIDKDFFFQDAHPARRLIELLSKYSVSWDPEKGEKDPLFQEMQRNVIRVQKEFDQQLGLFDEVVNDLESFIQKDEIATIEAIEAPIKRALQKEKFKQASIAAINEISLRTSTGEVTNFVETFLENRWTKVLTLAYSVKDEKPHAIADAIKTMDDLIWSIKPKITLIERQEMINRLPGILARLNKWLSLIKWEDEDRVQFFADLAECHASIVRAPLELSPERQMEIAVEAAKFATERRLEKRANAEAEAKSRVEAEEAEKARLVALAIEKAKAEAANAQVSPVSLDDKEDKVLEDQGNKVPSPNVIADQINEKSIVESVAQAIEDAATTVANLERGVWVQFIKSDNSLQKVRLAWVSPMRSLFIFTSSQKEKSFSVSIDELERNFRQKSAKIISVDKVVDRALLAALNRPKIEVAA